MTQTQTCNDVVNIGTELYRHMLNLCALTGGRAVRFDAQTMQLSPDAGRLSVVYVHTPEARKRFNRRVIVDMYPTDGDLTAVFVLNADPTSEGEKVQTKFTITRYQYETNDLVSLAFDIMAFLSQDLRPTQRVDTWPKKGEAAQEATSHLTLVK